MSRMNTATIVKIFCFIIVIVIVFFAVNLLDLYTQLSRYQNYWNKHNKRVIASGKIDYVAFGDSAAQGVGASRPFQGYPGLIQQELEHKEDRPIGLVNLSKSGGKIKDVLDTQLPAYRDLNLDEQPILTIEIGANDMVDFEQARFEKEMDSLMSQLPPEAIISDIPSFEGSRYNRLEKNVVIANVIMYRLAEKHGFSLVPLHDQIQNNNGLFTFGADLFHPSNKGYRENWAPVFLARINS